MKKNTILALLAAALFALVLAGCPNESEEATAFSDPTGMVHFADNGGIVISGDDFKVYAKDAEILEAVAVGPGAEAVKASKDIYTEGDIVIILKGVSSSVAGDGTTYTGKIKSVSAKFVNHNDSGESTPIPAAELAAITSSKVQGFMKDFTADKEVVVTVTRGVISGITFNNKNAQEIFAGN